MRCNTVVVDAEYKSKFKISQSLVLPVISI